MFPFDHKHKTKQAEQCHLLITADGVPVHEVLVFSATVPHPDADEYDGVTSTRLHAGIGFDFDVIASHDGEDVRVGTWVDLGGASREAVLNCEESAAHIETCEGGCRENGLAVEWLFHSASN